MRHSRRRFGGSLAVSLLVHALALGALAWATGSWLRVAAHETPVFVTLLAAAEGPAPAAAVAAAPAAAAPPVPAPPPPAAQPTPHPVTRSRSVPAPPPPRTSRPARAPRPPAGAAPTPAGAAPTPASPEPPAVPGPSSGTPSVPAPEATAAGTAGALAASTAATRVYGEGEVDRAAVALGGIRRPEYPARERMLGREGRVTLLVEVDASGRVGAVTVARSGGEAFDASARRAVARTPFRAARLADRAVASTVTVEVSFELE